MTYKNHLQSIKALMRKDNEETLGQNLMTRRAWGPMSRSKATSVLRASAHQETLGDGAAAPL